MIRLFGGPALVVQGRRAEPGPQTQARVLAALAMDAGAVVPTETLVDRVWGSDGPATARRSLQSHLTRLRRVLVDAQIPARITRRDPGYVLELAPACVDILLFRKLRDQALAPGCPPEEVTRLLERALALESGPALVGIGGEWARQVRLGLESEVANVAVAWARAAVAIGDHERAIHRLHDLVAAHPLVEPLAESLIRALHAAGRGAESIDAYLAARERLVGELGVEPGPAMRELYAMVLRDEVPESSSRAPARDVQGAQVVELRASTTVTDVGPVQPLGPPPRPSARRRRPAIAAGAFLAVLVVAVGVAGVSAGWRSDRDTAPDTATAADTTRPPVPAWSFVEDFSGKALKPEAWGIYEQPHDNGSMWSPSAVRVTGGELQITGTGRTPSGRGNVAGGVCWCNDAAPLKAFGVWQVKAKFDTGAGYGAAIGVWPHSESEQDGFMTLARIDQPDRRRAYFEAMDRTGARVTSSAVAGDFTTWNTFTMQWRPDSVAVWVNDQLLFDSRTSGTAFEIPTTPMYLFVQVETGPDGPIPAANAETPERVVLHVDDVMYAS